jgi:hypothetical protein
MPEAVKEVDANSIENPILRDMVKDIQKKSTQEIFADARNWTDENWRQWREHSSHNPW